MEVKDCWFDFCLNAKQTIGHIGSYSMVEIKRTIDPALLIILTMPIQRLKSGENYFFNYAKEKLFSSLVSCWLIRFIRIIFWMTWKISRANDWKTKEAGCQGSTTYKQKNIRCVSLNGTNKNIQQTWMLFDVVYARHETDSDCRVVTGELL